MNESQFRSIRSTVAILGGGPSISEAIVDAVLWSRAYVIAINDVWKLAPDADVLFACDVKWWQAHPEAALFRGKRFVCQDNPRISYAKYLPPHPIGSGSNSALQAAYWAAGQGAQKIVLFGIDLRPDELTHWHGQHADRNPTVNTFARARKAWADFAAKTECEVVNCSARSALECFPKATIEDALA